MINMVQRSKVSLNLGMYREADTIPWPVMLPAVQCPYDRQYILRMCIYRPETLLRIPAELQWLQRALIDATYHHLSLFGHPPFVYVTIRHGLVSSVTDDEWHVDGFSLRKDHLPEHNYIWSDSYPTESLMQNFAFPLDFDPLKHNIQTFFQHRADESKVISWNAREWNIIDPYIVHRRPAASTGKMRTMVRISFLPLEIEDDNATPNPLMPSRVYGKRDIRLDLKAYR